MRCIIVILLWLAALPVSAQIVLCTGGDVPGSVVSAGYEGCTAISHYQAGIKRLVTVSGNGAGVQSGNPEFADISLTRGFDISSHALRVAAINGSPGNWSLHFLAAACTGQTLEYQRINLTNAVVSGFSAAVAQDMAPAETVNLTFSGVEYVQTTYDQTCQVSDVVSFGWDRLTNTSSP